MELTQTQAYAERGLDRRALDRLSAFGDLLLNAGFNVTSIREPEAIERFHFSTASPCSTSLPSARRESWPIWGLGRGCPALVLALALPDAKVTAVESQQKKCCFIQEAAAAMGLQNVEVRCARAEEYGRAAGPRRPRRGRLPGAGRASGRGRVLLPAPGARGGR